MILTLPWPAAAQHPYAHLDDESAVREWIKTISSDAFGGRKPMTFYEDATVGYLEQQLGWLGLQPAFGDSWTQPFRMAAVTCRPVGGKITVKGRRKADLKYPDDLIVWTARTSEKVTIPSTEYVFCGFGINAPEYGWNDYADVDVRGKIVIAMVNDPGYYDASLFRGRNMTYYGRWLYKFEEARRQGAAGCLVLHETAAASYGWDVCVNGHLEGNLAIYDPETGNADELAMKGWLHQDGCRKLFKAAGLDMDVAVAAAQGRTIFFDDDNSDGWFFRSDHYNFVKKGVPAVVVENGLHPVDPAAIDKYPMKSWYHQPRDEYRDDWDLSGTMANIYMLFSVGLSLANTAERP